MCFTKTFFMRLNSFPLILSSPDTCRNSPLSDIPSYRRTENSKASQMSEPFIITLPMSPPNGIVVSKSPKVMLP